MANGSTVTIPVRADRKALDETAWCELFGGIPG